MEDLDHRVLGKSLELYHIQENAPGMVFWHPRGYEIYRVVEDYVRSKMRSLGYREVRTPQLMPLDLWKRSGHWEKFGHNMFRAEDAEGRELALKPMSCPCHLQIFNVGLRSWRDLPVRYCEFGACHRNEPSGALHGLMRTKAFEQDDAHVLCAPEHVRSEVSRFAGLLDSVYRDFGFAGYSVSLATRPDVRHGPDDLWDWAEGELFAAAAEHGYDCKVLEGEGAFYGPKLEFGLLDREGRSWQCGTVQLDFVLPARLDASYVGRDGNAAVPLMIHHAVLGSLGRFIAMLIEHHGGNLPVWLSPDQIAVMPVSEKQAAYAVEVSDAFVAAGLRSVLYDMDEKLGRKIVEAKRFRIPHIVVVGAREEAERSLSWRSDDGRIDTLSLDASIEKAKALCRPPSGWR